MARKEILDRIQKYIRPFRVTKGKGFRLNNYDPGDTCGLKLAKALYRCISFLRSRPAGSVNKEGSASAPPFSTEQLSVKFPILVDVVGTLFDHELPERIGAYASNLAGAEHPFGVHIS